MSTYYYLSVEKNNGDYWEPLDLYTKDGNESRLTIPRWIGEFFLGETVDDLMYVIPYSRGLPKDSSSSFMKNWGIEGKYNCYCTWYDYIELLYLCDIEKYATAAEALKKIIDIILDVYDIYTYLPNQVRFIIAQG